MKIKVGGRYVARDGEVVEIIKRNRSEHWPIMCDQARSYTAKGRHISDRMESDHDLMHEFKDEGAPSKLSTVLTGLFWLAVIIGVIGFWGIAAVKLWQMIPGN